MNTTSAHAPPAMSRAKRSPAPLWGVGLAFLVAAGLTAAQAVSLLHPSRRGDQELWERHERALGALEALPIKASNAAALTAALQEGLGQGAGTSAVVPQLEGAQLLGGQLLPGERRPRVHVLWRREGPGAEVISMFIEPATQHRPEWECRELSPRGKRCWRSELSQQITLISR